MSLRMIDERPVKLAPYSNSLDLPLLLASIVFIFIIRIDHIHSNKCD